MILLDTHIWVWWADGSERLAAAHRQVLTERQEEGLGVSIISCWEVAKLVESGRLRLGCPLADWMAGALAAPGIALVDLTPQIAIESTSLPGPFHKDPADQIIVATARAHDIPLLTVDGRILQYPHVRRV